MPSAASNPRPLDHLILPTGSIAIARTRLSQLGFTVAADARHPFGTENACVFFQDKSYLEPLGVASAEECAVSARSGNMFTARDQAFRFRRGDEGFSGLVFGSEDADAEHGQFVEEGVSGGPMLQFSRTMTFPDGSAVLATFKLTFAADLRAPDFFFVTCQRINVVPVDRSSLEAHPNGVTGIASVVLFEPNPDDFRSLLEQSARTTAQTAENGLELVTGTSKIEVLNATGFEAQFGKTLSCHSRGLRGKAVVFRVSDLTITKTLFDTQAIVYSLRHNRLIVEPAPGQGAIFAFEEMK